VKKPSGYGEGTHGGDKDQHDDILRQQDKNKEGGGSQKRTKRSENMGAVLATLETAEADRYPNPDEFLVLVRKIRSKLSSITTVATEGTVDIKTAETFAKGADGTDKRN
jgi:hypothetical protein